MLLKYYLMILKEDKKKFISSFSLLLILNIVMDVWLPMGSSTPQTQKYTRRKYYEKKKKRLWVELKTSPIKGKVKKQRLCGRKRIKQLSSTTQHKTCLATS